MSGRLAPATSRATGTPRLSVSTDRLVPILARSVGFLPVFFPPERGLRHAPVDALPVPVDAQLVVVLGEGGLPEFAKHALLLPALEVAVEAAAASELRWSGLPLATGPQDVEDPIEYLTPGQGRASSLAGSPDSRQERFETFPEHVGDAKVVHDRVTRSCHRPPPSWAIPTNPLFVPKPGFGIGSKGFHPFGVKTVAAPSG